MLRARHMIVSLLLAFLGLGLTTSSVTNNAAFKIIVHPANPVSAVRLEFLREAYLKKATDWPDGTAIRPIELSSKLDAQEAFARSVLRKTPSQLRSYWTQRIFSGTGVPPPVAATPGAALTYVLAHPGAVAYVPLDFAEGHAKTVRLVEE